MSSINTQLILRFLQASPCDYISEASIAESLSIPDAAIKKHIDKLQEQGFQFDATTDNGYRLFNKPKLLFAPLIEAYLLSFNESALPIYFFEEVHSTMDTAKQLIAKNTSTPFTVIGRIQTQGRGRLGRLWDSTDTGNLYLTLVFQPNLPPSRMEGFSLWIATSLCQLYRGIFNVSAQTKWPNDLLYQGKKLGGILVETQVDRDLMRYLIIGIGININSNIQNWSTETQKKATSLAQILGTSLDPSWVSAHIIRTVYNAYTQFLKPNTVQQLPKIWDQFDYLKNRAIYVKSFGQTFSGTAIGISPTGKLLLQPSDTQELLSFNSADVSLSENYK